MGKVLVILFIFMVLLSSAQLSEGPNNPAGSGVNGTGDVSWTNTGDALSNNATYANVTLGKNQASDYITITDFGFSMSDGAIIDGITVEIERFHDGTGSGTLKDKNIYLTKDGTNPIGQNRKNTTAWDGVEAYHTYGGTTDLWGSTWTGTEIKAATFGVMIKLTKSQNGNRVAQIDHVRITINYSSGLPIELLYFNGEYAGGYVLLNWVTKSETNNDYFTIKKSKDTSWWVIVDSIQASGNSSLQTEYSYTDNYESNYKYYQLSQTDLDGKTEDVGSTYIYVNEDISNYLAIYPNPATTYEFVIVCCFPIDYIEIYDTNGTPVDAEIQFNKIKFKLPGLYIIKINGKYVKKIIIK